MSLFINFIIVISAALSVIAGVNSVHAQSSAYTGEVGGPLVGPAPLYYEGDFECDASHTVLLIQDVIPWFAPENQNPLGAIVTELLARNKQFCIINSNQITVTDLSQFKQVILAAAQTQTFYNNLFPGGVFYPPLTAWVQAGGILAANLTDCASGPGASGTWATETCNATESTSFTFVGGVKHGHSFVEDNNIETLKYNQTRTSPTEINHPTIDGQFGGTNGGVIVDDDLLEDLDNWGFSSHGYFVNLPVETKVILTQPDVTSDGEPEPVMIQYPFGEGLVFATLTTTEWRYVGDSGFLPQNRKLLANEIGFQNAVASFVRPMTLWSKSGFGFGDDWIVTPTCETTMICDSEGPRPFQHAAIDVNAQSAGQSVFAAASGEVVLCGGEIGGTGFGQFMVLEHSIADTTLTTVYWHVVPFRAPGQGDPCPRGSRPGKQFEKGEQIATVDKLRSLTPHLHFGIRLKNADRDSARGALPPAGTDGCVSCFSRRPVSLPPFPSGFTDPDIFIPRID